MADQLTNEQMHGLLDAWERWDERPADRDRVVAYENALGTAAAVLSCTVLTLRAGLVRHKADGLTRAAALTAYRKELAAR